MAFWSDALSEPKRQHRFILDMPMLGVDREGGGEPGSAYVRYLAKAINKPSYTIGETEHKFLGNTFYYPGALTWDNITATIVNSVDPNGDQMLYRALYQAGYYDPSDQGAYFLDGSGRPGTPNKAFAQRAMGTVKILELNGAGVEIDSWTLNNAWITNVKFGDLDYAGEELLNIELTMRYDWATYLSTGNAQAELNDSRGAPDVFSRGIG